ncbi:hypothetical protein [Klebsiella spallanzanii]|uniref:Uncharacterized protein n=1 Tax=Klebsiella spallanzanii TaxID=2587528 RepID=A0A564MAN6_9ENTR|nr:hypothetical protein [Klebsiella spallanzanii]VUS91033.1 hypothetical protein SB6408_05700 [Klebsiella spallanzanii]
MNKSTASPSFEYVKGSGRHFIGAPEWATLRTRTIYGDAWLERHEIGARVVFIPAKHYGTLVISRIPSPDEGETVIAERILKVVPHD